MQTDVGAFSVADSFYGTFDQGGNVYEWNDAVIGASRGVRGGSWGSGDFFVSAAGRLSPVTSLALVNVGFRVVIVPEPSVTALAALGTTLLIRWRRNAR
jgi:formylglycine-generating enzyme required for sulfatase activity